MEAFKLKETRNCRRFFRYCYTLAFPIDAHLVDQLGLFGLVEVNKLSQYSPQFKDTFKICFDDQIEICGTLLDKQLYLTVNKQFISLQEALEDNLKEWFNGKRRED